MSTFPRLSPCPSPPAQREGLSGRLRRLASTLEHQATTLRQALPAADGRSSLLMLIVVSLPFLLPVSVPVLSTVSGTLIALIGIRLLIRPSATWPRCLADRPLPKFGLPFFLRASSRILAWLDRLVKKRIQWLPNHPVWQRAAAGIIVISGLLLLLPLPVPFSNFLPAATIVLLAAGMSEEDGLVFLAGLGAFLASLAFFAAIFLGGSALIQQTLKLLSGSA